MSIETQTHVGCLVINLSCGSRAKGLQSEVERYLKSNGVEWTCQRFKAYWNIALHLRNGDQESAIKVMQENSISYDRKTCLPKGPWKYPINQFVIAQKPSKIRRYAAALRFYSGLSLTKMSKKQASKAENSISGLPKLLGGNAIADNILQETLKSFYRAIDEKLSNTGLLPRIDEQEIFADRLKSTSYYYSRLRVPSDLRNEPYASMTVSLMTNSYVPPSLDYETPGQGSRQFFERMGFSDQHVGRIVMLQEQGCKGRVVAQPSAWVQLAFMPLHHSLNSFTKKLFKKESCLHDQVKGAYAIQDLICRGLDCFSVDLSSATDRFPRTLSIEMLRKFKLSKYADAMEDICTKTFKKEFGKEGDHLVYGTGQPMGLYGSFPLFHLSNAFLAEASVMMALDKKNTFLDGTYFKVLGDDIVFSDYSVAEKYTSNLRILGVDISPAKSFSGKVAEFAGFVAVRTKKSVCVFRPYKVPDGNTITNPLEFLHAIGFKVDKMGKYWKKQIRAYQCTIGKRDLALSPLLPNDKGVVSSIFRGDNQKIHSLAQVLYNTEIGNSLPQLTNESRNRLPLFHERRVFDWYGFNKQELTKQELEARHEFRTVPTRLRKDALFKALQEDLAKNREELSLSKDPYIQELLNQSKFVHNGIPKTTTNEPTVNHTRARSIRMKR